MLRSFAAVLFSISCLVPMAGQCSDKQPPVPLESGTYTVNASDGTALHVEVGGKGPTCLFVHGGPGQGVASFRKLGGERLEDFLTVIYLDQRGSGKSKSASNYHLDRVVDDIDEVRAHFGVSSMCLIAHSFGGIIAQRYAVRYPDRVSALVLANALMQFRGPYIQRTQIALVNRLLGGKRPIPADPAELTRAHLEASGALWRSGLGYRFLTENLQTLRAMNAVDGDPARNQSFGRAVITQREAYPEYYEDYAPATADVSVPVLVIAGTSDYAVGPDQHLRFKYPHQRRVVIKSGHLLYYDAPDEFTAAVREFAKEVLH